MRHRTPHTDLAELDGAEHIPGMVPDPLIPRTKAFVGSFESRSFWITLNIPADARPGLHKLTVRLAPKDGTTAVELPVIVDVSPLVIRPRQDFPVIHWWRGEATWDYYQTGMFDDRWWKLTRDAAREHARPRLGRRVRARLLRPPRDLQTTVPAPGRGQPSPGVYEFDWAQVKRFTDMARRIGFKKFEWSHLWIYWGVENPMRVYTKRRRPERHALAARGHRRDLRHLPQLPQAVPARVPQVPGREKPPGRLLFPPLRRARQRAACRELQARPARCSANSPPG